MSIFDIFSSRNTCSLLSAADGEHLVKYRHFRTLLNHNRDALRIMAELEQLYFTGRPFDLLTIKRGYEDLFEHVLGLSKALIRLSGGKYSSLPGICQDMDLQVATALAVRRAQPDGETVLPLELVHADMHAQAGGKAVNLAIMKNSLQMPAPEGFVITAAASLRFLSGSGCLQSIREKLPRISPDDLPALETASAAIRQMVLDAEVPEEIALAISLSYRDVERKTRNGVRVALRSSAVGEDTEASFAGQYATVLNVTKDGLLDAYKKVVASKYSPRALSYRLMHGLEDEDTPMCVLGLAMIDAEASGVMYTADPSSGDAGAIKISALWGLGEQLVSGSAPPDTFVVRKESGDIIARDIANKTEMLVTLESGGTRLEAVSPGRQSSPCVPDEVIRKLADFGMRLEQHYQGPQDIEWAIDAHGNVFLLQSRPLHVEPKMPEKSAPLPGSTVNILSAGLGASFGIATGAVYVADSEKKLSAIPDHAILVAKTASPSFAEVVGRINGIITDIGSITSHLSSVAREFGVPAIVNAGNATSILQNGEIVTMIAEAQPALYRGIMDQLVRDMRPPKRLIVDSPVHRKLRTMLDSISPLNLTNPDSPDFTPEKCRTFHDIIRFCHEYAMREMFDVSSAAEGASATAKLTTHLPLAVYAIDVGGGLRDGLTTCDQATADDIESVPMKALWNGFTHPGVSWSGTVNFDAKNFMTLMASTATSELGPAPGGDSYALLARDYMNFSAKFGYHFATIDALCSDEANHNYLSLQFTGGAGSYFGRSLRVQFLGNVLSRLGFQVDPKGDLLEATFNRYDRTTMLGKLDLLGRLLATSRLLDMALSNQNSVESLTEAFFAGDYDFLRPRNPDQPASFYTQLGHWRCRREGDETYLLQDGLEWKGPISGAISGLIGKTFGSSYQEFLDTIGAYFYFPLAIAKNGAMGNGAAQVAVKPVSGSIDRAGGIVFGLKNIANYFVFRINALEDNAILFEYVGNKRIQRQSVGLPVSSGKWQQLKVGIEGSSIQCFVGDRLVIEHTADALVKGHVGIWTKADSVTCFGPLIIEDADGIRTFSC